MNFETIRNENQTELFGNKFINKREFDVRKHIVNHMTDKEKWSSSQKFFWFFCSTDDKPSVVKPRQNDRGEKIGRRSHKRTIRADVLEKQKYGVAGATDHHRKLIKHM